jgi:hypothetical protein
VTRGHAGSADGLREDWHVQGISIIRQRYPVLGPRLYLYVIYQSTAQDPSGRVPGGNPPRHIDIRLAAGGPRGSALTRILLQQLYKVFRNNIIAPFG